MVMCKFYKESNTKCHLIKKNFVTIKKRLQQQMFCFVNHLI